MLAVLCLGGLVVPATTIAHTRGCHHSACDKRIGQKVGWHAAGATTFGGPADAGTTGSTLVKNDIGAGGGPIAGLQRVVDLWWRAAVLLGVGNAWSGRVLYRRVR